MPLSRRTKDCLKQMPVAGKMYKSLQLRKSYRLESSLLSGKDISNSNHQSIIHLSFNKAATQHIKDVLSMMAINSGLKVAHLNGYAFATNLPFLDQMQEEEFRKFEQAFYAEGYLYSSFGGPLDHLQALEKFLMVVVARDPRDILVSNYFSLIYSHPEPYGDKLLEFRQNKELAREIGIDRFILEKAPAVLALMKRYRTGILVRHPNSLVCFYEDMVSDYECWIAKLQEYVKLSLTDAQLQRLLTNQKAIRNNTKENINQHVRSGKSGDFRQKLKPDTVVKLNDLFEAEISAWKMPVAI